MPIPAEHPFILLAGERACESVNSIVRYDRLGGHPACRATCHARQIVDGLPVWSNSPAAATPVSSKAHLEFLQISFSSPIFFGYYLIAPLLGALPETCFLCKEKWRTIGPEGGRGTPAVRFNNLTGRWKNRAPQSKANRALIIPTGYVLRATVRKGSNKRTV